MSSLAWEIFEIVVNIYQGAIMLYFPFKFLGGKFSDKFIKNYGLIFTCILAVIITIFNQLTAFEHIYIFFYFALIFIYSCLCLDNNIYYKLFASVCPLLIVTLCSVSVIGISSIMFGKSFSEILIYDDWQRFIIIISVQLLILYTTIASLRLLHTSSSNKTPLSKTEILLITVIFFTTIIIEFLFCMVSLDNISDKSRVVIAVGFVCLIVINIVTLNIITDLKDKNDSILENERLKIQLEYNKQYIENADTEYELIKKLRHDTKNVYVVLDDFLSNGNIDKARAYMRKMIDIADERMTFVKTENDVVNSVINAKLTIASSFGINVTCLSHDSFNGIDDIDLCRLLSNMLENAISATSQNITVKKEIILKITEESPKYVFMLKNSIDESVLKSNPMLNTTKKLSDSHGYGTKIIKDISEKYNGRCDFYEDDGMFCCLVVLLPKI